METILFASIWRKGFSWNSFPFEYITILYILFSPQPGVKVSLETIFQSKILLYFRVLFWQSIVSETFLGNIVEIDTNATNTHIVKSFLNDSLQNVFSFKRLTSWRDFELFLAQGHLERDMAWQSISSPATPGIIHMFSESMQQSYIIFFQHLIFVTSACRIELCTTATGTCWSCPSRGSSTSPRSSAGWRSTTTTTTTG